MPGGLITERRGKTQAGGEGVRAGDIGVVWKASEAGREIAREGDRGGEAL